MVSVAVLSTFKLNDRPRNRVLTSVVNCSTGVEAVFDTTSSSVCKYLPPGKFLTPKVNVAVGVLAVESRNVMSGMMRDKIANVSQSPKSI